MKILIISHYYKHKNAMASIRPIKLAKYFAEAGHDVTVLTSMQRDNWCKQEVEPKPSSSICELYAPEHRGMAYLQKLYKKMQKRGEAKRKSLNTQDTETNGNTPIKKATKPSIKQRIRSFLSWAYYYGCDRFENYCLYKGLILAAKKENLRCFDFVIATYPGAGVHAAGEWIKKHKRAKYFVADYRDPAYNPGGRSNKIELRHDKKVQDKAISHSDAIVCVSSGMAKTLEEQYIGRAIPPITVITNGYDLEDHKTEVKGLLNCDTFNFVYTGALYNGRRTVDMLAAVLRELIDESQIKENQLAIHYAGPDFSELLEQLRPYNLCNIAVDHGYVSRNESLAMQKEADVVLLLNWNDDNYIGVIPGKLYEYMASQRTIYALIMGNRAGSETAEMIRQAGIGVACEKANPQDMISLKEHLSDLLNRYKNGERVSLSSKAIEKYNYKFIATKYLDVLSNTLHPHA